VRGEGWRGIKSVKFESDCGSNEKGILEKESNRDYFCYIREKLKAGKKANVGDPRGS